MEYIIIAVGLVLLAVLYLKVATYFGILDQPNHRSSHQLPTLRGGGILFYISLACFEVVYGWPDPYFFVGLTLLAVLSFTDDLVTLSANIRLPVQFLAMGLILYPLLFVTYGMVVFAVVWIITVGFLNIYNFMDGINGLTGVYSSSVLLSIWAVIALENTGIEPAMLVYSLLALVVFLYFNFRRHARMFAGDVGSIVMGALLLFLLIQIYTYTSSPIVFGFVALYFVDGGLTIVRRILLGENIFKAHRRHFYQVLVDSGTFSHRQVACLYGVLQLSINLLLLYLYTSVAIPFLYGLLVVLLLLLSLLYAYGIRRFLKPETPSEA